MIKVFDYELSGNCYKVRLMLSLLGLEHQIIPVNFLDGEHKFTSFLKLNPLGQVPVLTDGDLIIRDSQAILVYLARQYGGESWLPVDAKSMSKVVQWLSVAANEIQHGPATTRLHFVFNLRTDLELAQQRADVILRFLNEHLREQRDWLELDRPTIADVACYPYIELAPEGRISLESYPNVAAWMNRIKKLRGYVGIPSSVALS